MGMGIDLPPYFTYVISFHCIFTVLSDVSFNKEPCSHYL